MTNLTNFLMKLVEKTRYYNFALSFIPKNEWLVKIDADQIYIADKLKNLFLLPKYKDDAVILPRIQLHYDGKELSFIQDRPFNFSSDHLLIFNDEKLHHVATSQIPPYPSTQRLETGWRHFIVGEITNWHFPKTSHVRFVYHSRTIPYDEFLKNFDGHPADPRCEGRKAKLDMKMLDKDFIMSYVGQFDFSAPDQNQWGQNLGYDFSKD